jgi:hypothetical protein
MERIDLRERGGQVLGQAIGEELVRGIAHHVVEGQHDDAQRPLFRGIADRGAGRVRAAFAAGTGAWGAGNGAPPGGRRASDGGGRI